MTPTLTVTGLRLTAFWGDPNALRSSRETKKSNRQTKPTFTLLPLLENHIFVVYPDSPWLSLRNEDPNDHSGLVLTDKGTLAMNYRIHMIHSTDPKKLKEKEDPTEDA